MAHPSGVVMQECIFGKAIELIPGTPVRVTVSVTPSRHLRWAGDGTLAIGTTQTYQATAGSIGTISLPVTDQSGVWKTREGDLVVLQPGQHTHTYTLSWAFLSLGGAPLLSGTTEEMALPKVAGPIDLDSLVSIPTEAGESVSIADVWSAKIGEVSDRLDELELIVEQETEEEIAQRQGYHMYFGETQPPAFMYGVPVFWTKPVFQAITIIPAAPFWDDYAGSVIVSPIVGATYQVTQVTKGGVTTPVNVTIPPSQSVNLATLLNVAQPFNVRIDAKADPRYVFPSEYFWLHTFPDMSVRTLVTSDSFTRPDGEFMSGVPTDVALGGVAKVWQVFGGHTLDGATVTSFHIQGETLRKRSSTEFYGAGATYTGDSNNIRFDAGAQNQRVEFDLNLPAEIPVGGRIDVIVGASSSTFGSGHLFTIIPTGVNFSSPASGGSVPMSTASAVSGKYIFEVDNNTVRVKTPNEAWFSRSFTPPALTTANGFGTYFALRDTHARPNSQRPLLNGLTYSIDNLIVTKLGI